MRRIIPIHLHPLNLDRSARIVAARPPLLTVYQVTGGFIACVNGRECFEGTFDTIDQAREAQDEHDTGEAHEEILAGLASERPHSRTHTAEGRAVQWTYDGRGGMA